MKGIEAVWNIIRENVTIMISKYFVMEFRYNRIKKINRNNTEITLLAIDDIAY